ncbi:hypothetical protein Tco_0894711 [Tanacetum coccineum]|uniref:Uncharacterized protein n=1 Tax=Tanacetum coccineum TaxID=301880 RepID=A0ABQ5CIT7_9ASTR
MIGKINLLWKNVSEKLNDAPIPESAENFMASENIASISLIGREEFRRNGINPSHKRYYPKYLPSHQSIKAKEEVKEVIDEEESEVETDEEVEEILEDEEEEGEDEDDEYFNSFPTMEELTHHEWLLKNPRPP